MASGIDTDAVVKSMVSSYQTKIDKANQAQQTLQWKQDSYRTIITGIKGYRNTSIHFQVKYMLSGMTMNINSTTNSDSSKFSATTSSSAKTELSGAAANWPTPQRASRSNWKRPARTKTPRPAGNNSRPGRGQTPRRG